VNGRTATLSVESREAIALLRLARPEKRNALDLATIAAIEAFFSDPPAGVRVAILTGTGDHFCAGLDLGDVREADFMSGFRTTQAWHRAFAAMEYGTIPVIAALHGATIGGGLELAAAAHIRIGGPTAFYALPEGQRGIFLGGGGSVRLPRLIGTARVMDLMLTGRVLDADAGHAAGITQYRADDPLARALELAAAVANNAPLSNLAILQALPRIGEGSRDAAFLTEAFVSSVVQSQPEAKERIRAFLEHRAARVDTRS
jgi:enoyl-CoA hydratase/carnithine racemase